MKIVGHRFDIIESIKYIIADNRVNFNGKLYLRDALYVKDGLKMECRHLINF
jgi:hypothetical protein